MSKKHPAGLHKRKPRLISAGAVFKGSGSLTVEADVLVGTLRKTYGSDFAKGFRGDTKLSTVLGSTGAESLDEYVEHYERAKALAKATGTSALSNTIISITSSHFEPALKSLAKK
jgi:hypothetical protein